MAIRNLGQQGLSLIQLSIAMGVLSVALLIALQVTKFQATTSKKITQRSNHETQRTLLYKQLRKEIRPAIQLSTPSSDHLQVLTEKVELGSITTTSLEFVIANECNKMCLVMKKNGVTSHYFPSVKNIKVCGTTTSVSCAELHTFIPDSMELNNKRLILKFEFYDIDSANDILVFNLSNIKNDENTRDDYILL